MNYDINKLTKQQMAAMLETRDDIINKAKQQVENLEESNAALSKLANEATAKASNETNRANRKEEKIDYIKIKMDRLISSIYAVEAVLYPECFDVENPYDTAEYRGFIHVRDEVNKMLLELER